MEIWYRFPKFVLGFIIASVVFSFFLNPDAVNVTKGVLARPQDMVVRLGLHLHRSGYEIV